MTRSQTPLRSVGIALDIVDALAEAPALGVSELARRVGIAKSTAHRTCAVLAARGLLDRTADVHLARRSGADGWLVKPLDPLRLRKAVRTVLAGGSYQENLDGAVVVDGPLEVLRTAVGGCRGGGEAGQGPKRRG